jgi:hypothetical protein
MQINLCIGRRSCCVTLAVPIPMDTKIPIELGIPGSVRVVSVFHVEVSAMHNEVSCLLSEM